MTVTEQERQEIIRKHEEKKRLELREHMRSLGKRRSKKKREAGRKNAAIARAARLGRKYPGMKKK